MLNVNSEILRSVPLHENLELEKLQFSAGASLYSVVRAAVVARSRRAIQSPVILEAAMRSLEKQTQ